MRAGEAGEAGGKNDVFSPASSASPAPSAFIGCWLLFIAVNALPRIPNPAFYPALCPQSWHIYCTKYVLNDDISAMV
jgi:hypothetical protein